MTASLAFGSSPGCAASVGQSLAGVVTSAIVPGPAANLSATVTGSTVMLTWTGSTGADPATSYVIEAGSAPGAANLAVFDTGTAATTITVVDVPAGGYYVRVRGRNSSGVGAASNEIVVTVGGGGPCVGAPAAPTGLSHTVNGSSLTLSWTAAAGGCTAATYQIEAGSASGASDLANFNTGNAATSFATTGVPNGTYFVRVRGVNGSGAGPASNEITVIVGGPPPTGGPLTGRWIGLVANGDGLRSTTFCDERWDWQLDLTQSGNNVTGMLTQTPVTPPCPGDPPGSVAIAPLVGTVTGNAFSFVITTPRNTTLTGNATFTAARMTGTTFHSGPGQESGTFAVNKN